MSMKNTLSPLDDVWTLTLGEVGAGGSVPDNAADDSLMFDDGDPFPLAAQTVTTGVTSAAKPVASIATLADYLVNGYWLSDGSIAHHWASSTISYNISGLNSAEQLLALSALQAWSEVANIGFVQVASGANITFTHNGTMRAATQGGWYGDGSMAWAIVNISTDWVTNDGGAYDGKTGIDSYAYQTYVHELGHALGLGHQGPYNGSASYGTNAIYANDTWQYSIMSYFSEPNYSGSSYRYVITPQMADIYAVGLMYGASTTTRTGNTVYGFNNTASSIYNFSSYTQAPALTIYDSGGNDTLDCSGYSSSQTIDLNAGTFSSVGGLTNNIGIALSTTIENAIGGSGSDTLRASSVGCTLTGRGGNDALFGGSGTDTAVYSGNKSNYTVTYNSSTQTYTLLDTRGGSPDGTDTVTGVEYFQFSDGVFAASALIGPPNNPPNTPVGHDQSVASGTIIPLTTLFTGLTDPDAGDTITEVWVRDRSQGGGRLTFNGVAQDDYKAYGPIPLSQLSQWGFMAGGTDTLGLQIVDSHGVASANGLATVTATAPAPTNNPPNTPVGHDQSVASGTIIPLTTLFTGLTDPDAGDTITEVWVRDRSQGGGRLTFNGVAQDDYKAYGPIPLSQLSQWGFMAGGTDTLGLQIVDSHGVASANGLATVTATAPAPTNNPPNTPVAHNQTVASGTSVALSTLFTGLTDPDAGDSVTQFLVSDVSAGGGHLTLNGVVQNDNQSYGPIPISQLSQWAFVAGGTDTITFQTLDSHGTASASASATVSLSGSVNNPPNTPVGHDQSVASGTIIPLTTLFTGLTDPDAGDTITEVWVRDRSQGGGRLTFNGVAQDDYKAYGPIPLSQLSQWGFMAGGTDTLGLQIVDSHGVASANGLATVTATAPAPTNNPPNTPVAHNQTVASGTSVALSTLFTGLTDPDAGDSVTQFLVSDVSAGGGHLTLNGVVQNDNQSYGPIPISQLSQWAFVAGGTDTITFQTLDSHGTASASASATVSLSGSVNNPPNTPVGHDQSVASGTIIPLTTLFTGLTDPDAGDTITEVWVRDRSQGGGRLTFNGVAQDDYKAYGPIPLSQLSQWGFMAGGTDTLGLQIVDSHGVASANGLATVTATAPAPTNNPPNTPVGHDQSVASGTIIPLTTLFTGLTDPDVGDTITEVWVRDRSQGGGRLTFNGVAQDDYKAYGPIPLSQLSQWGFMAGGTDTLGLQIVDSHGVASANGLATVTLSGGASTTIGATITSLSDQLAESTGAASNLVGAYQSAQGFAFRQDLGLQGADIQLLGDANPNHQAAASQFDSIGSPVDPGLPVFAPDGDQNLQKVLLVNYELFVVH